MNSDEKFLRLKATVTLLLKQVTEQPLTPVRVRHFITMFSRLETNLKELYFSNNSNDLTQEALSSLAEKIGTVQLSLNDLYNAY